MIALCRSALYRIERFLRRSNKRTEVHPAVFDSDRTFPTSEYVVNRAFEIHFRVSNCHREDSNLDSSIICSAILMCSHVASHVRSSAEGIRRSMRTGRLRIADTKEFQPTTSSIRSQRTWPAQVSSIRRCTKTARCSLAAHLKWLIGSLDL